MDKVDKIGIEILYYMRNKKIYTRLEIEKQIEQRHKIEKNTSQAFKNWGKFCIIF